MPGQPLGALSTVGPLETASGQKYPLLNVGTEDQLLHDATVASTFWGHQGYVAWGPRSPQAQKAVNRLLDGCQNLEEVQAEQLRRQKRNKPPPPLHFTDSYVILGSNGVDPNVRMGTPSDLRISSPISPGPRQTSPNGCSRGGTVSRAGISPGAPQARTGGGVMSAAVDAAARASAQHIKVGRHGKGQGAGVRPESNRGRKGVPAAKLTPTTVSDWEILLEQNRSRMMASIEDVTRLIGLPYLGGTTQNTKAAPLSKPGTSAVNGKGRAAPKASKKPQVQQRHLPVKDKNNKGTVQHATNTAATSLMTASAVPAVHNQHVSYEDAAADVDDILAPLGPWHGPQALGNLPPPKPWNLHQEGQSLQPQQHTQSHYELAPLQPGSPFQPRVAWEGGGIIHGMAGLKPPHGHTAGIVYGTDKGSPLDPSPAAGLPHGATAPAYSFDKAQNNSQVDKQLGHTRLSSLGAEHGLQGLPASETPEEHARLAQLHAMRQEGQAVLDAQQALLQQGQRPQPQTLQNPYQQLYKQQLDASLGQAPLGKPYRMEPRAGAGDMRYQPRSAEVAEGHGQGGPYTQGGVDLVIKGQQHMGEEGVNEGLELKQEASFSEQLGPEQGDGMHTGRGHGQSQQHQQQHERQVEEGEAGRAGSEELVAEASFGTLPESKASEAIGQGGGPHALAHHATTTTPARSRVTLAGVRAPNTIGGSSTDPAPSQPTTSHQQQQPPYGAGPQLDLGQASSSSRLLHTASGPRRQGEVLSADGGGGKKKEGGRVRSAGLPGKSELPWPPVALDTSWMGHQQHQQQQQQQHHHQEQHQQQQQQQEEEESVNHTLQYTSYPFYYSEEQKRQLEAEQQQEHRHQPVSEQQRQQLQERLIDAGISIPRGSRVIGLQTCGTFKDASDLSTGTPIQEVSGREAEEGGAGHDSKQAQDQGDQEVLVVVEDGAGSSDGQAPNGQSHTVRTRTLALPAKHPVLTSGIQYTVVKAVGVPLMRRQAEAEEEQRVAYLAELEAELGAPMLARQQREGRRAGKALRRMSGSQDPPPPPSQGVSMVKVVPGKRQASPAPRDEPPPQPIPAIPPPPMPIPSLANKTKPASSSPAPKVPQSLPSIRPNSDKEEARTSNSNATTFGHAITDIGRAKMQDVWIG